MPCQLCNFAIAVHGRSGAGVVACAIGFSTPYTNLPIFYSTAARIAVGLTDLRSLRLKVGMVFQQFDLYPHLAAGQDVMLSPTGFFG